MLTIPDYHITEPLYESAHSLIYRAYREADHLPVVLKLLRNEYPSPEEFARFRREYEMTRNLDVDGVIEVYGLESYKNTLVMVLEDFGGESLTRLLMTPKPVILSGVEGLELKEFLRLAIRISDILGAIHQQHIMHKDINPSNIVWNPDTDQLKIIDFGISTTLSREQPEIRNPEVLEGTLAYISPEQTGRMNRAMDYRTDLYSLGATFYHLLTGQLPFQKSDAMELVHCHLAKMPVPPCELPGVSNFNLTAESPIPPNSQNKFCTPQILSAIILKLMAKNVEDRYQNAFGLKADLQQCLDQLKMTGSIEAFDIGQHDMPDRFQIPQKLYGREQEIDTLLAVFDRVSTNSPPGRGRGGYSPLEGGQGGVSELILVAGYAGIGKSSLVNEIQKPIVEKRGYFISGKFDQFRRNIPYSALIQAFQGLIRQLLSEPEDQIALWKEQLLKALGPNGQVMIEVIPDLELILGEQPEVPDLPPAQAQNRFNFGFQNFVRTCSAPDHPLALFLDDLQWADLSSLQLLELLITDPNMNHMLIIGAYRDNEVFDAHPLMLKLNDIRQAGATVNTITLKPLELDHVNHLIADTLHLQTEVCTPEQIKICTPLAELSLQKTGGNPFFLIQFLHSLYEEGFLEFDPNRGMWEWDLEEIRKAEMTENVVELMAGKIQKLSEETQHVLRLAACIGSQFDLQTLSIVYEHSPTASMQDLREALQEELIIPLDDSYKYVGVEIGNSESAPRLSTFDFRLSTFRFLHDRVQQAAYSLIKDEHKQEVHLTIGRLLLANTSEAEQEEKIFEMVNHLDLGKDLITGQSEKDELAELNLMAGRKAKASAAYKPAYEYLKVGIDLLKTDSWQQQYNLTLALYVEAAEAAYLSGEFEQMEHLAQIVLQQARTLLDKVKIYEVKIDACKAQNKLLDAVQTGLSALKLLGVTFPEKPNKFHILYALLRTKFALVGKQIEDFINLPEMTDPYKLAIARIAIKVGSAVQFAVPALFPLILCKLALLSKYGNAPASAILYAAYGNILSMFMGDVDSGYRFGNLALSVLERFKAREFKAQTVFVVNLIKPRKDHARETLHPFQEVYQTGLETGDVAYAALSAMTYSMYSYFTGKELTGLERETASYTKAIGQLKHETSRDLLEIYWQVVLNLMGKSENPCLLVGEAYDEEQMLPRHLQAHNKAALLTLYSSKLLLCYLFQAYPQAVENATLAETHLDMGAGSLLIPLFHFYDSLARLGVYPEALKAEQRRIRKKVAANQKKMKKWAHYAPMNFLHKFYLVEAERARVLGKDTDAMDYYDKAIEGAKEHEYLNEEALANELAARFYLANGKEKIARTYMREARYCYLKWGATAKVQHLDQNYPELLRDGLRDGLHFESGVHLADLKDGRHLEGGAHRVHLAHLSLTDTATAGTSSGVLDLAAVMKASQTLSGEIHLDKLLETIMRTVIENAGAEKGVFIEHNNGQFVIQAEGEGGTVSNLLHAQPVEGSENVPLSIIHYVAHSKQPLVLDNASADTHYASDSYIQTYHPKSVLCFPVLSKAEITAIIYLENNLSIGAFTPERVEVLKLLSSQAAISLENARLYETLEHKVQERTFTLEQEIAERKRAEETARAANQAKSTFLTNLSHELRTPLNAILGYTQILRRNRELMDRDHDAIETIHHSGEHLVLLIDELLDLSRIEARQIELRPTNVHLPGFLKNIVEMTRIQAKQKGVGFDYDIPSDLPSIVQTDEQRLRQILLNLLNNAIKFTDKGSVKLRIANCELRNKPTPHPSQEGKSEIRNFKFEIQDTGIGIPPEHLQNIFLPLHQVGDGRLGREGTGLGLTISQQLVRMMGSELYVKSTVGQGTTFWFDLDLPVVTDIIAPVLSEIEGSAAQRPPRIIGYKGSKRKILLVDDNEGNLTFLRDVLSPLGFEIMKAIDGREALDAAKEYHPDLILIDLLMPIMDGFEATRHIRRIPALEEVIVIGISASAFETTKQESFAASCDDFLIKPIQIDELLEKLRVHLNLEWNYERQNEPQEPITPSGQEEVIPPPPEELSQLYQLAKIGNVLRLQERLQELTASDPKFAPFEARITQLADELKLDDIEQFIKQYIKDA